MWRDFGWDLLSGGNQTALNTREWKVAENAKEKRGSGLISKQHLGFSGSELASTIRHPDWP